MSAVAAPRRSRGRDAGGWTMREVLARGADVGALGILWALACLPLLTALTATAALCAVVHAWRRGLAVSVRGVFGAALRRALGAGLRGQLILLAPAAVGTVDLLWVAATSPPMLPAAAATAAGALALSGSCAVGARFCALLGRAALEADRGERDPGSVHRALPILREAALDCAARPLRTAAAVAGMVVVATAVLTVPALLPLGAAALAMIAAGPPRSRAASRA